MVAPYSSGLTLVRIGVFQPPHRIGPGARLAAVALELVSLPLRGFHLVPDPLLAV